MRSQTTCMIDVFNCNYKDFKQHFTTIEPQKCFRSVYMHMYTRNECKMVYSYILEAPTDPAAPESPNICGPCSQCCLISSLLSAMYALTALGSALKISMIFVTWSWSRLSSWDCRRRKASFCFDATMLRGVVIDFSNVSVSQLIDPCMLLRAMALVILPIDVDLDDQFVIIDADWELEATEKDPVDRFFCGGLEE